MSTIRMSHLLPSSVRHALSCWAVASSSLLRVMSSISASARSSERIWRRTSSASVLRPVDASHRGDSGTRSMPTNRAIAGSAQTASMTRQTPSPSPHRLPITAFTRKAASCPITIMSSLRPESDPRTS
jgi:hypothetical protein